MLSHLLDKHASVVCLDEPELAKYIAIGKHDVLVADNFKSIRQVLDYYGVENERYLELARRFKAGEMQAEDFLKSAYELCNSKGATLVGAKEVNDLSVARAGFPENFPQLHKNEDCPFIFIDRDIKGITTAFVKYGFYPPGKKPLWNFFMKSFAKQYVNTVNRALAALPVERTLYLTFKELLDEPYGALKKIFAYLGVEASDAEVKEILETPSQGVRISFKGIQVGEQATWREHLKPGQAAWLDSYVEKNRAPLQRFKRLSDVG